jgi:hypothetical protein
VDFLRYTYDCQLATAFDEAGVLERTFDLFRSLDAD